jgi:hypothetical protein
VNESQDGHSMHDEGGDTAGDAGALEAALDEAMAELPDTDRGAAPESMDQWLGIGLRLGIERPEQARHLLERLGARGADRAASERDDVARDAEASAPDTAGPEDTGRVPVASSVLARSAGLPLSERAEVGPEVTFGWVTLLTPREILALGRVVAEMLAAGAPQDIGRGFGFVWDAGVRIPRSERDAMIREFTELQVAVGSVLAGRDLRAEEPAPRKRGLAMLIDQLVPRRGAGESQAASAIDAGGEPARRGLVALWNAWVAMRYRARIPSATLELLVRPWVTVVGPLPEP